MVHRLENPGEAVDAEVEETATCEIEIHHAVPEVELRFWNCANAEVRGDSYDFANVVVANEFPDLSAQWEISCPYGFHEKQVLLFGSLVKDLGLCCIYCECLLAQHWLVVGEAQHGVLVVMRVWSGDINNVHIWIFHKV